MATGNTPQKDLSTYSGLSESEVIRQRALYGENVISSARTSGVLGILKNVALEPMFLLLIIACSVYFMAGQFNEGLLLIAALIMVAGISVFQETKSASAIEALKKLSSPKATVVRAGLEFKLNSSELVVDDLIVVTEGELVPADARLVRANDLAVNESILTGESFAVQKNSEAQSNQIFLGTQVTSGQCLAQVTAVGSKTRLGKLGQSLDQIKVERTPLQLEIDRFVHRMALAGGLAFVGVWLFVAWQTGDVIHGLINGLTLAMSILPEELPVAFSVFMALGAMRLVSSKVLTRRPHIVESLGSASVICLDKTGTLTKNEMSVAALYSVADQRLTSIVSGQSKLDPANCEIIDYAMWSSEVIPFDPMEISIHALYQTVRIPDLRPNFSMVHEYPLSSKLPVMCHIFQSVSGQRIVACKGAPEVIIDAAKLGPQEQARVMDNISTLTKQGMRVLGVAKASHSADFFPDSPLDFDWQFLGLIAFIDPPRDNMRSVLEQFYQAGVAVKMITGDFPDTALKIAEMVGLKNDGRAILGKEIAQTDSTELRKLVRTHSIFARVAPEIKLKIIEALKADGEVVAMTGDGVNDGPALKAAHIGIAMGLRGTEVARQAASLILLDDDLSHMVTAIGMGRRIYSNLKKAFQYIVSIHIPIVGIVTLPLFLDLKYNTIFSPIHVIFLELVMGPTCSIVYENEPIEGGVMTQAPRKLSSTFLTLSEMAVSVGQGLVILIGLMFVLILGIERGYQLELVRTLVFATLVLSNIFLTLTDRSRLLSIITTSRYKNNLVPLALVVTALILAVAVGLPPLRKIFMFSVPTTIQLLMCISIAGLSTLWFEAYKGWLRHRSNH